MYGIGLRADLEIQEDVHLHDGGLRSLWDAYEGKMIEGLTMASAKSRIL